MPNSATYDAFMLDHAAGTLSPAMALAGDLHILLSDEGAETGDLWRRVAEAMDARSGPSSDGVAKACDYLTSSLETVKWRRGLSGAHCAKSGPKGGQLMRLLPGKSVPTHGHKSLEVTIVLEGQLTDGETIFHRGDIMFGEPGARHKPAAEGEAPCVCYVAKK